MIVSLDVSPQVNFSCPHCGLPYLALRQPQGSQHSGTIMCVDCGEIAFEWTDFYTMGNLHPVRMNDPILLHRP